MAYKTCNPYTGETTKTFDTLTDTELEAKLAKAHEAYQSWSKTSFEERAAIMHRAADLMIERRDQLACHQHDRDRQPHPDLCLGDEPLHRYLQPLCRQRSQVPRS